MSAFTHTIDKSGIAILTFDLPGEKVNKLTTQVMNELSSKLDELAATPGLRALVIRSGKAETFIVGADIAEIRDITDTTRGEEVSRNGQKILQKIEDLPVPTVAAIHGPCLGGGLELALACSHRAISDDSRTVLGLPEVKIGILPGFGGTQRLPRLVGLVNSLDMILTGKSVHPRKAKKIGLADEVAPREGLLAVALSIAQHAMGKPRPTAIRARRNLAAIVMESNPLTRSLIYRTAGGQVLHETRGAYPAPLKALEAVRFGLAHGRTEGFKHEAKLLGELIPTEISKNLINVFYLNEALKKDTDPSPVSVRQVGVLGAGIMGGGIAQLFAERGMTVRMRDITSKAVGTGLKAAGDIFRKRSKKGIINALQARDGMDRITGTTDLTGFKQADVAVEAVVENMDVKKNVLRDFELHANKAGIFASNTSSLSITELATVSNRPERVVGMHFFNPVEKMPLVEVVRGKQTSAETVAAIATLSRKLGKLPVIVNDGPGFLVNRILMPYLGEALRMAEEGTRIEVIDAALLKFGMPMGAFILLDEIGIDIAHKVSDILRQGLGDRIQRSVFLETLYMEGFLGKKNGKGFYLYTNGRRGELNRATERFLPEKDQTRTELTEQEIIDRAVLLMIKEAVLCLEEKIVDRADHLDAALIFGIGFPPFRGGLLRYAEHIGARAIVEKLEAHTKAYGDRFSPPRSLIEMSRDGLIGHILS